MNILIVIHYFGGLKDGNPDVVDLAIELQKRGHTVTVLTASYGNDVLYEEKCGVNIFRIRPLCYLSGIDYNVSIPILKLYKAIKKCNIEIVHGVMEFATQTLSAAIASAILKKPFILTIQGAVTTFGSPHIDAIASVFDRSVLRIVSLLVKNVVILSENLSERAYKIGVPREKIRVIPSGIHYEEEFNPDIFDSNQIRKELDLEDKIVVGFSGRLVRLKGLIFLLSAQKILQRDIDNLHLLIIGDGPERPFIESVSRKLNLNTTITGWMKRSDVPLFLSAVDIFVNPSLTEGLPIAVMEAMAMEKAVVATDVGGTSDLIENGKNGFLVPPSDVGSLVSAIKALAFDEHLKLTMGQANRNIIKKNFDWDIIVSKMEKVYEETL